MSAPYPAPVVQSSTVDAIIGVRLDPRFRWEDFDDFLCREPSVQQAWHVAGDVDIEFRLSCTDRPALGAFLARLRAEKSAAETTINLILRPVHGLGGRRLIGIIGGKARS
ncbi:Lrp/AsnC ligand binding domain-containing protein [Fodinicola feengrottensis]|uniref:Transcription regulator AsnC/Lrp ligand binding domain-containing protein n=1 Tax=Fodinicola feengrottensis TaxID=435914 RepID=A0ABN2IGT5_9ACTN|nr:Lrp/AsnC ligand binding domain-containing protein [Fodinicola feengrottensis]